MSEAQVHPRTATSAPQTENGGSRLRKELQDEVRSPVRSGPRRGLPAADGPGDRVAFKGASLTRAFSPAQAWDPRALVETEAERPDCARGEKREGERSSQRPASRQCDNDPECQISQCVGC